MNTQIPTVDQFLASSEPDEDDEPQSHDGPKWHTHALPPDPMERIADSLSRLADHFDGTQTFTAELVSDGHNPAACPVEPEYATLLENIQITQERLADTEAERETLTQVISDVEAALGKSKAAPALAAKAVIEAWRTPPVPETEDPSAQEESVGDALLTGKADLGDGTTVDFTQPAETVPVPVVAANPDNVAGHTRVPHPDGFDFCQECSGASQQWVHWPCDVVTQALSGSGAEAGDAIFVPETATTPQQPAHNAPVEEWREYARALGYAGPEIDKANRSMIRTTLGVVQPTEGGS